MMNLPVNIPYVDIEIVLGCFLRCRWCILDKERPYQFMGLDLFKKIIDELERARSGYERILLFRSGEPFLHPNIAGLLTAIEEKPAFSDIVVEFYTNGMVLSEEQVETLVTSPLNVEIIFSIDGIGDRESFEYMRPGAIWERMRDSIQRLAAARSASRYRNRKKLSVSTIIPHQEAVPFFVPPEEEIKRRFSAVFGLIGIDEFYYRGIHRWNGNHLVEKMPPPHEGRYGPCYFVKRGGISVLHDGKVSACCNDMEGNLLVGDLNHQSLAEIYYGQPLSMMREMMLQHRRNRISTCQNCDSL